MGRLITRKEAAKMLDVEEQTISNWIERGVFTARKIKFHGKLQTMLDKRTLEALLDDAHVITECKRRMEQMREEILAQEKEFTFRKLCEETKRLDNRAMYELQDIAIAFIIFASDGLDKRRKQCLRMFVEGCTMTDIAESLQISRERVRQIIRSSARRMLDTKTFKEMCEENESLKEKNDGLLQAYNLLLKKIKGTEDELSALKKTFGIKDTKEVVVMDKDVIDKVNLFNTAITDLPLSIRALNCLKAAEIKTLGELVQYNYNDLLKFRNFGKKSLREIEDYLDSVGCSFGMEVEMYYRKYHE